MKDIYKEEIDKKLVKLNNGNYSSINGVISLCISILQRRKGLYDVNLILYQYWETVKNHKKGFNKIYVLTSDKIYILMPENVKTKIDELIDKMIDNNFDCKKCYNNYIDSWNKITEFYNSYFKEKMISYADKEAHKILGNQVLKYFKDELYLQYSIEQILQDLYSVLSQNEEREKSFLQRYVFNKDLSIYAKKEYAFKQKFSNYIGREM